MRKLSCRYDINYNILDENKYIIYEEEGVSCYSDLYTYLEDDDCEYIELLDVECEETIKYWKFYCEYIGKIFKLDYKITDDSFIFKLLDENRLNLLVCSLIRYLWEISESVDDEERINEHLTFFESLYNDKDNLKYNLEEFCLYYKKAGFKDINETHQISSSERIKIKSYNDLIEAIDKKMFSYDFINQFFTKENKKNE